MRLCTCRNCLEPERHARFCAGVCVIRVRHAFGRCYRVSAIPRIDHARHRKFARFCADIIRWALRLVAVKGKSHAWECFDFSDRTGHGRERELVIVAIAQNTFSACFGSDLNGTKQFAMPRPPEVAAHPTGAAVVLTLKSSRSAELNIGSVLNANDEESSGACYTACRFISQRT